MIIPTKENIILNKKLILDILKVLPKITKIDCREDTFGLYIYIKIPIIYHRYIEDLDSLMHWLQRPRFHIHYTNIFCKKESVDKCLQNLSNHISKLKWMESIYITLDDVHINNEVYPLSLLLNMIKLMRIEMTHVEGIFGFEFIDVEHYKKLEDDLLSNIDNCFPNLRFIVANKKNENTCVLVKRQHFFIKL